PEQPSAEQLANLAIPISDLTGASLRFTLLDAQGRRIFGNPRFTAGAPRLPIDVDGKRVGWLTMLPFHEVTEAGDMRFQQAQFRASAAIGIQALVIAAFLAIWLTRTLMAPVHRITSATRRLAAGDVTARVDTAARDELGQLARDFNQLAVTLERNEHA